MIFSTLKWIDMKQLLKTHFYFLLHKKVLILSVIVIILFTFACFMYIKQLPSYIDPKIWMSQFLGYALMLLKTMMGLLAVLIFSFSFFPKYDFYAYFILPLGMSRWRFCLSKIILLISLMGIMYYLMVFIFFVMGFLYYPYFFITSTIIKGFIIGFCIVIIYGLYGMLLAQWLSSPFIIIIPLTILIVTSNMYDADNLTWLEYVVLFFFPTQLDVTNDALYGIIQLLWLVFTLIGINLYMYYKRDLQY